MTREEAERAFCERLPVTAMVGGVTAEKIPIEYKSIYGIRRRWSEKRGGEVTELELLDKNGRSLMTVGLSDVHLSGEQQRDADGLDKCLSVYETYFGLVTPKVCEDTEFYLRLGLEAELICRVLEYTHENGNRSWSYAAAILNDKLKKGIKTAEAFEREEAARRELKAKAAGGRSQRCGKLNNYTDTNKPDYSGIADMILKEMLAEG